MKYCSGDRIIRTLAKTSSLQAFTAKQGRGKYVEVVYQRKTMCIKIYTHVGKISFTSAIVLKLWALRDVIELLGGLGRSYPSKQATVL